MGHRCAPLVSPWPLRAESPESYPPKGESGVGSFDDSDRPVRFAITFSSTVEPPPRRIRSTRLAAVLVVVVSGCGGNVDTTSGATDDPCPATVADGGIVDGVDLAAPDWLPEGFPIPASLSIRHINHDTESGGRLFTGFVPDGDPTVILTALRSDLGRDGFEMLLAADGFIPMFNVAFVALSEELGLLVMVDVTGEELPVRAEDGCRWRDGVLVGFRFEQVDPDAARSRYSESYLTQGSATATIGDQDFFGEGECFVHDGTHSFVATAGARITLHLRPADGFGFAGVTVPDEADFALDVVPVSGVEPAFGASSSGFFVDGMFIDAVGDQDPLAGRVEVTCG
jgi:hypothetical protein